MPKVSVIIPAFNSERFIGDAIESVLGQTYKDFELIVVDDGSQDQTAQRVRQYGEQLTYLYQSNSGVAKARNLGHTHSGGEYLAFLDSDDRWYPRMLEVEVKAMDENPQAGLVYSDVDIIDEEGKLLQERYLAQRARRKKPIDSIIGYHWIPFPSASLKRRNIFEKAGCFDVSFYQGGEDVLLWAKMYRLADFLRVPQSLAQRRTQHRQISHAKERRFQADLMAFNKLWTLCADEPDQQADLLITCARIWSREGQRMLKEGNLRLGREYLRRSFRYYPFYFRNYIRLIRSYFYRRSVHAKPKEDSSPEQPSH
jgi:glycosyltransferase involved in cell wall biosynthesis